MSVPKPILPFVLLWFAFLLAACRAQGQSVPPTPCIEKATIAEIEAYFVKKDFRFETFEPAFHGQRRVGLLDGGVVQLELHGDTTPVYITWVMTGPGANERVKDYLEDMTVLARMVAPSWRDASQWLRDATDTQSGEAVLQDGYQVSFDSNDQVVHFFLRLESEFP